MKKENEKSIKGENHYQYSKRIIFTNIYGM